MKAKITIKGVFVSALILISIRGNSQNTFPTPSGAVGIGTTTPVKQLNVHQVYGATNKGILISGDEYYQPGNGDANGVLLINGVNRPGNRQLWIGDNSTLGSTTNGFFRYLTGNALPNIDAVTGNGLTRLPVGLATPTSNVAIGFEYTGATGLNLPASRVAVNGNMAIGNSYIAAAAPLNGLIVQGNVGIGTLSPTTGAKLHIEDASGGKVLIGGAAAQGKISLNGTWDNSNWNLLSSASDKNLYLNRPSDADIWFRMNNTSQMVLKANASLGIGIGITGAVNSEAKLTVNSPSIMTSAPQQNINDFNGTGLRINSSNNDINKPFSQDAITYQSGLNGGGAAIAFGRGGSWDTFMSFYTNDHDTWDVGHIKERMRLDEFGNLGIGTSTPHEKLSVNGNILAKKVRVSVQATDWSDYVFDNRYKLRSLSSVEKYIAKHKHLPDVPSAEVVEKGGLDLGSSQALLLRKIEELTLYVIEQGKKIEKLEKQNEGLRLRLEKPEKKALK